MTIKRKWGGGRGSQFKKPVMDHHPRKRKADFDTQEPQNKRRVQKNRNKPKILWGCGEYNRIFRLPGLVTCDPVTWEDVCSKQLSAQLRAWDLKLRCKYLFGIYKNVRGDFALPEIVYESHRVKSFEDLHLKKKNIKDFLLYLLGLPSSPTLRGLSNKPHKVLRAVIIGLLMKHYRYDEDNTKDILYEFDELTRLSIPRTVEGMKCRFHLKQLARKQRLTFASKGNVSNPLIGAKSPI